MISTYLKRKRLINGLITGVLVSAGFVMLGVGSYQIISDITADVPVITFEKELEKKCKRSLREASLSPYSKKDSKLIDVAGYSLEDAKTQISQTSLAIQQCVGYELETFCMGTGCDNGVVSFTLKPTEGSKDD
jgi:hypothetical protein